MTDHQHYWFLAQVKAAFEPVVAPVVSKAEHGRIDASVSDTGFYRMVEYAYLICTKCGTAKKEKVK